MKAYVINATTNTMKAINLDVCKAKADKVTYIATLNENKTLLTSKEFNEHVGNEPAAAEYKYFACAMLV